MSACLSAQVSTSGLFQGSWGCTPRKELLYLMVTLYFTFQRSTIPRTRLIFTQQWLKMLTSHTWRPLSAVTTMPRIKTMNLSPVLRGAVDTTTLLKRHLWRGTEADSWDHQGLLLSGREGSFPKIRVRKKCSPLL